MFLAMSVFNDRVAAELRARMARDQLTIGKLAERIGVGPMWVSRRVKGELSLSTDDLETIVAALGGDHVIMGDLIVSAVNEVLFLVPVRSV